MNNGRPSAVDSPYTNARSPSGHHLVPYSPAARRPPQDIVSWMGSQTSLHDEPSSVGRHTPETESPLQTSSSTTVYHANPTSSSHVHMHQLHVGAAMEAPTGDPDIVNSFPQYSARIHFDTGLGPHPSAPQSIKSASRLSVSQKSFNSRSSTGTGRASYREHRGPPARVRTPASQRAARTFGSSSSVTLERAGPGDFAAPGTSIALPSAHDPNLPGDPIVVGQRFYPMSVSGEIRYEFRKFKPMSKTDEKIEAMAYEYPKTPPNVPKGWIACRHPEGALYFVHQESKTFTEVNICDNDVHGDIEQFRDFLFSELENEIKNLNPDSLKVDEVELVLEPKFDERGVMCCYYFVNPPTRSVFWLDEWGGDGVFSDCKAALSDPHKGLAIEAQYWCATRLVIFNVLRIQINHRNHWDLFPNSRKVTQELKDEVVDMILHATCDQLTSDTSTCPLNLKELKNHLAVVDRIDPEKTGKRGHCAVIIGRIMHSFYRAYFIHYYGEDCARLNFDETVHGWRYHPSLLMTILAPLFFMVPMRKLRLLHRIFVDGVASKERWNMFLTRLNSQFQAISVLATVLLNANVAFLPKESGTSNSPQQYLSYMSLVTSMASIILGLFFMGNNRLEERIAPAKAAAFLSGLRHENHGLETLAIIYSLPYAFLMWGMCLFLAAFAAQWFYPGNTTSRACAAAFISVVAVLVVWSIWTAQDASDSWWFMPDPYQPRHKALEDEEKENDEHFDVPKSGFFHRLSAQFIRRLGTSSGECHTMQQRGSIHDPDTRSSASEHNLSDGRSHGT